MKKNYYYTTTISHKNLRKTLLWETGDGRFLSIKEMDDNHLLNTTAMLRKKQQEFIDLDLPCPEFNNKSIKDWNEIFTNELKYRKLI